MPSYVGECVHRRLAGLWYPPHATYTNDSAIAGTTEPEWAPDATLYDDGMRRLRAGLVAVISAVALVAGCSPAPAPSRPASSASASGSPTSGSPTSSKKASAPLPDAATILKEASAVTAELTGVRLAEAVVGGIEKIPVKSLHADLTDQPDPGAKGGGRVTLRGADLDVTFIVFRGDFYAARSGARWVDYGSASAIFDPAAILSPDTGLAHLLTSVVDPEVEARETLGDQQTVRVTGHVAAAAVNGILPQLDATGRMPCTVWIQETGDHRLVQLKLVPADGEAIHMFFSNWNEPVTVEKPLL